MDQYIIFVFRSYRKSAGKTFRVLRSGCIHEQLVQAPEEDLIRIFDGAGFSNMWN